MNSHAGYIVFDCCDDFEQALRIDESKGMPVGGVLDWRNGKPVTVFRRRASARAAIARTHHYREAFGEEASLLPEKKFCKVVPFQYAVNEEAADE